jgi:hypothetical protein
MLKNNGPRRYDKFQFNKRVKDKKMKNKFLIQIIENEQLNCGHS